MSNITYNNIVDPLNHIKYIIMQTCYIPSVICCIFTLSHFLLNRNLRSALHNHTPLALLIISTFDLLFNHPFTLSYLRIDQVIPSTNTMCISWNFFNSLFTVSTYWTMAWSSIERHFLIFHPSLFTVSRGRLLFHYIPLFITALIYPIVVNIVIILLYPCTNQFNMRSLFCGYSCALKISSIAIYARIAHNFIPVFIVTSFTVTLIARLIKRKQQIQNNQVHWRRCRRMIIQLLALASLFLILTLPATTVSIVENCCAPSFAMTVQVSYFNFLVRFLTILMPFICLSLIPELWSKPLLCKRIHVHPLVRIHA